MQRILKLLGGGCAWGAMVGAGVSIICGENVISGTCLIMVGFGLYAYIISVEMRFEDKENEQIEILYSRRRGSCPVPSESD